MNDMGSIETFVISLLWDILLFLIIFLAGLVIKWLKNKIGIERMKLAQAEWDNVKDLAAVAVKYAEQAYMAYGGAEKKEKALAFLSRELAQLGIKVSSETLSDLIEAVLREIKDEFGEEWVKAVNIGSLDNADKEIA